MANTMKLETAIETIEQQLLGAVDNDDDHALFIASYLHGHFDLVVSHVLSTEQPTIESLDQTMLSSLSKAFANNELVESDALQVKSLWQKLLANGS